MSGQFPACLNESENKLKRWNQSADVYQHFNINLQSFVSSHLMNVGLLALCGFSINCNIWLFSCPLLQSMLGGVR